MTQRYKPGSRVQKVWEVFEASGAEAAFTFGLTLDLKTGTLKEWMRMFAKLTGTAPAKIPAKLVSVQQAKSHVPAAFGKRRVYVAYDPERHGTVVAEGSEVSVVRWDNGTTVDQNQPNERLLDVGTPLPKSAPKAKPAKAIKKRRAA